MNDVTVNADHLRTLLIDEFAKVLSDPDSATTFVRRAGVPPSHVPAFKKPLTFWTQVVEDVNNGLLKEGIRGLTACAVNDYPGNSAFRLCNSITTQDTEILQENRALRKQNESLQNETLRFSSASSIQLSSPGEIATLDDAIHIEGTYSERMFNSRRRHEKQWEADITWRALFALISPHLLSQTHDDRVKSTLACDIFRHFLKLSGEMPGISDHNFQTIKVQFLALDLVMIEPDSRNVLYWSLTNKGKQLMLQCRTIPAAGLRGGATE